MNEHEALIRRFYTAFQQLDYATMQDCYSDEAVFSDPVFGLLDARQVKAMWKMLCTNAKNFSLTYSDIQSLDEAYATCQWTATYTLSKTGRHVVNKIKAHMQIENGKIIGHTDKFDLWNWSRQALGISGLLFGWSNFMQGKIHKNAKKGLEKFMALPA
ncbi:MAG: nuclear transport factor 2 family protein [Chitinophagaceae bacterium]